MVMNPFKGLWEAFLRFDIYKAMAVLSYYKGIFLMSILFCIHSCVEKGDCSGKNNK